MGRAEGVREEQLRDLGIADESDAFDDTERLVVRYADAMTRTLVEVPAEMFVELRRCFSDPEIVELTTAIAWENWRARFNHALDIESLCFESSETDKAAFTASALHVRKAFRRSPINLLKLAAPEVFAF